jgi:hypothetical protein
MSDANPYGDGPDPGDGTGFAEVLNGLTLGGKRRREKPPSPRPRPRPEPEPAVWPEQHAWPEHREWPDVPDERRWPVAPPRDEPDDDASFVRPYAWTGGRTKSAIDLRLESLLTTTDRARNGRTRLQAEHQSVAELCGKPRSVAEVASLLCVPLGVAKVLLGDMAELGLVTVHKTANGGGNASHLKLMERVLSGLRRL